MDEGNWIPLSKGFLKYLPRDRPYTELEAAFSLMVDYDQDKLVTVTGYSHLWRWSKGKVLRFFNMIGVEISYPECTTKRRNQRGLITIHKTDLKRTKNGLIKLIDNKRLSDKADLKRTKNGLKTDQSRYTTTENNTNNKNMGNDKSLPGGNGGPKQPNCPQQKIIDLYHEALPELPNIVEWDDAATTWLRARWRSKPEYQTLEFWKLYFEYVRRSKFLMKGSDNGWIPDLRWLVKSANFTKVMNGNYHNDKTFNAAMGWVYGNNDR